MALRPSFLTVFLFLNAVCFCQHDLRRVNVSTLPEEISILKDVSNAIRWTDSTGDNVVVTTQKIYRPSDDIVLGRRERGLAEKSVNDLFKEIPPPFTYFFTIRNDSAELKWKIAGKVPSCEPRTKGDKVKSSLVVTDLNKDKIAEVWVILKGICLDYEGIAGMKIIMYHDNNRYSLSGSRDFQINGETIKGKYIFDEAFKKTLPIFIKYAEQLWKKNQGE